MKQSQLLLIIVFSILVLLLLRGFMELEIRLCLSKKERKQYRRTLGPVDRWFFWTSPQVLKDKYSHFEKKVIHYRQIVSTYKFLNIIIHALFVLELLIAFLHTVNIVGTDVLNSVCILYFAYGGIVLFVIAFIELATNKRYHRARYRKQ